MSWTNNSSLKHFKKITVCVLKIILFSQLLQPAYAETIRIGLAMPKELQAAAYITGMYALFKEEVERASNGSLKVQVYYGGVLGRPDERLNQMRRNVIQMSDASDGNYATIHRDVQIFSMPYLFPSTGIAHEILDGSLGSKVAEDIRINTGIRVLGWWETAGFKHYSSNKPIASPADMRGQKMRVMSAAFSIPVTAMGGAATPIPMPELYISLKTGVVDGQDNAVSVFNMLKLYEVQKYLVLDKHIYGFGPMGINDEFFQTLSQQEQKIILDAGRKAIRWNRKKSAELEARALEIAVHKDVTVIKISNEKRKEFAAIAQPKAIEWLKSNVDSPELVDRLLHEVKSLEMN
ncbi:MAG: DctP family TRAP transporter solute-binding subunit [Gammaproteobacteria bacterium]|nr:DctP family TRAP transporter solute-binding subunit [Gammaproteobacteria bacterium]